MTVISFPLLSVADLVRGVLVLSLVASLLMFFRPLLSGLVRALVLTVRPRTPRRQRTA
ncbi:hypothetical protein [Massilia sp. Mn16-1_5]|uniref:hypothetical protein n=1 Tax=Massilia sp. Mn16-1_5 TaxID=2079199 RepID=UPI0014465C91|nr:hypothetical protein [Massilia sp. Mn16-1_5]